MDSQTFNVGIIGCGNIFPMHAKAVSTIPQTRLAAVCDIVPEKVNAAAKAFSSKGYYDWRKMLDEEELNAVHICLPHYLHYPVAEYALHKGISVLLEKPIIIDPAEAQRLIELADKKGLTLGVTFQNRFNPSSQLIRQRLDDGRLGKVFSARCFVNWARDEKYYRQSDWRGTWDKEGGGVTINQAIHTLDLLLWFMSSPVSWVSASINNHLLKGIIEVEDTSEGVIAFENGERALFYLTTCHTHDIEVGLYLYCEKGIVEMKGPACVINYSDGTTEQSSEACVPEEFRLGKDCWGYSHHILIKDFYDALGARRKPAVTAESATETQRLVWAIYESGKTGERVWLREK